MTLAELLSSLQIVPHDSFSGISLENATRNMKGIDSFVLTMQTGPKVVETISVVEAISLVTYYKALIVAKKLNVLGDHRSVRRSDKLYEQALRTEEAEVTVGFLNSATYGLLESIYDAIDARSPD